MGENEIILDAEKRWLSSARGMNDIVRSAFVSVHPRPITSSPERFMNYPGQDQAIRARTTNCSTFSSSRASKVA